MSTIRMVENTENILFEIGTNFTLKNTIMWTNKVKDSGYKLDPVTIKSFDSQNYNQGGNSVSRVTFRHSDYLVFEFKSFEPVKAFNSIYVSYPHMFFCKDFFRTAIDQLSQDGIYTKDGISIDFEEFKIVSEPLAKGKRLAIWPTKILRNDMYIDGITLLLGANEYPVDMDLGTFAALADMIESFDLLTQTNMLMMMTMQAMSLGVSAATNTSNNNSGSGLGGDRNISRRNPPGGGLSSGSSSPFNRKRASAKIEQPQPQPTQEPTKPVKQQKPVDPTGGNNDLFNIDNLIKAGGGVNGVSLNDLSVEDDIDFDD